MPEEKILRLSAFPFIATPTGDPAASFAYLYFKADGKLYKKVGAVETGIEGNPSGVTMPTAATAANELIVSNGANREVKTYTTDGLIKIASGAVTAAVAGTDYVTGDSTNTFTNKTFDANGTGNSISNIETADLAAAAYNDSDNTLGGATPSATTLVSEEMISQFVANSITTADVLRLVGELDASTNPNYPAADNGHAYVITVAGKVGGASGVDVEVGDMIVCKTDGTASGDQATVGSEWFVLQANLSQATTTNVGYTTYATQAETEARTISNKAVTPDTLANFALASEVAAAVAPYSQDFTSMTSLTITAATHGKGANKGRLVQVYEDGTPNTSVEVAVSVADNGDVTIASLVAIDGHVVIM